MENSNTYKLCNNCDYFCNSLEKKGYCPNCGTKLIDECLHCGKPIDYPYAKYCPFCGKPYRTNSKMNDLKEIK